MKLHNRFPRFGVALALASAATALGACGGSSMNSGAAPVNSAPPNAPVSSASTPPAVKQAQAANTPVDPAIVTADNGFGVALFQNLSAGATGNVCIAPISVAMALQIVYNGAAGVTQQSMAQTLRLGSMSSQTTTTRRCRHR